MIPILPRNSLWWRMFVQQVFVILIVTAGFSIFMITTVSALYREQIGQRALAISQAVSQIPEIRAAFQDPDPARIIQPIADGIRRMVGAEFVVVGNVNGIRYSHPLLDHLGQPMVGGDNGPALEGKEYISIAKGSLGLSIRGKVPVRDHSGRIVGVVSTGYLLQDLNRRIWDVQKRIFGVMAASIGVGGGMTFLLSRRVKRQLFNLEPEEIAMILQQREAILENSEDGIISIDRQGRVTMANRAARRMLSKSRVLLDAEAVLHREIEELLPGVCARQVIDTGKEIVREPFVVGHTVMLMTCVPIRVNGGIVGAVCTFRDQTALRRLEMELSSVKHYTEALRAQRHQFQNQLHVIAGLLSLGEVERAAEYLDRQVGRSQPWIDELREKVDDPVLVGLILSKGQLAQEAGVVFRLESGTRQYGSFGRKTDLVSMVVGNLLDNAIEAASISDGRKEVLIGLRTDGRGMWIRVRDTGPGVPAEVWDRMWERGVSSKGDHRGMGLPLILQVLGQFGGCIRVQTRTAQGNILDTCLFAGDVGREVLEEGVPPDFRPEGQWPEMPVGTVFTVFLAVR